MFNSDEFTRIVKKIVYDVLQKRGKTNEIVFSDFKQGRVSPNYVSGRPFIIFDGEETPSGKAYPYLSSYSPLANDVVILAKVGGTYVVLGKKL